MNCASQRMDSFSISVAIGDRAHAPQLGLTEAARRSANALMGDADEVM
jgi:hypothetical protein